MAGFDLHDAELFSVELMGDHSVRMRVSSPENNVFLTFSGVKRMRCLDFREGNIIFEVREYKASSPPVEVVRTICSLDEQELTPYAKKVITDVESGQLSLVHMTSSYGCEALILCEDVRLSSG